MSLQSSFLKRWLGRHDTPRSPHKEHGPKGKGHQGAEQAAHVGKIHEGLSSIFTGKNEGAGLMSNAPRPGFNVSIAGDSMDIGKRFQQLEDVSGVWEGEMEQSYMANLSVHSDPIEVLRTAAAAGKANDQDAVFVRYDGNYRPGKGWRQDKAFTIQTPQGIIDIISPSQGKLVAAVKLAKRFGGGQYKAKPVWTWLLERGKHY